MSSELPRLPRIPAPDQRNVTLRVDRSAERALRKRHPWLFESGIREQSREGRAGDLAVIFDRNRDFLAIGLYDPHSPIRVRVLHCGRPTRIDRAFFAARFSALARIREGLSSRSTTGYRVVNGENEGLPGLIVDRYADTLVMKLYSPAWLPHLRAVLPALQEVHDPRRVVVRLARETAGRHDELHGLEDGDVIHGPDIPGTLVFRENGLRFECDPLRGQKTGFFLDQRENRERVEALAGGCHVLNVFSYTGGFSLYAARGGARSVCSLDASAPALAAAQRNFALNASVDDLAKVPHECFEADAFEGLSQMAAARRNFDLVIVDPPSFARRQADVERAQRAYAGLVGLGLGVLRGGGLLVMASCSSRISAEVFFGLVHRAARKAGRPLIERQRTGHAVDHPIGFPQGAYLKCLIAEAP